MVVSTIAFLVSVSHLSITSGTVRPSVPRSYSAARCGGPLWQLFLSRCANHRFHLLKIVFERTSSHSRKSEFRARLASDERFTALHVTGIFQLACVYAEIAIGNFKQRFEVIEAEHLVDCERAHDRKSNAFVNQRIEFQALSSSSSRFVGGAARHCGSASSTIGVGLGHDNSAKINVL